MTGRTSIPLSLVAKNECHRGVAAASLTPSVSSTASAASAGATPASGLLAAVVTAFVAGACPAAAPPPADGDGSASIEGSYELESRTLADGAVLSSPDIVGLLTYTKTHRNFNLAWQDGAGNRVSYSLVSTYTLTDETYTETPLINFAYDETGAAGPTYAETGTTRSAPVTFDEGRVGFTMPFDPVVALFDGDTFTGTNAGVFVDAWRKVE